MTSYSYITIILLNSYAGYNLTLTNGEKKISDLKKNIGSESGRLIIHIFYISGL